SCPTSRCRAPLDAPGGRRFHRRPVRGTRGGAAARRAPADRRAPFMNPYTPPAASLAQDPAGGRISPERAAALQAELKSLNMRSFALGIPGMILQVVGNGTIGGVVGLGVFVLGTALLIVGLYFYAKMRGLHGAFSVFGLLSCVGL